MRSAPREGERDSRLHAHPQRGETGVNGRPWSGRDRRAGLPRARREGGRKSERARGRRRRRPRVPSSVPPRGLPLSSTLTPPTPTRRGPPAEHQPRAAGPILSHTVPSPPLFQQKTAAACASAADSAWLSSIPDAPTFYPSAEQAADPIGYIRSIAAEASRFGERREKERERETPSAAGIHPRPARPALSRPHASSLFFSLPLGICKVVPPFPAAGLQLDKVRREREERRERETARPLRPSISSPSSFSPFIIRSCVARSRPPTRSIRRRPSRPGSSPSPSRSGRRR